MVCPERGEIVTRSKTPRFFSITRIEARFVSATVSKTLRIPDKHVFVKAKTFMMAVFDTDKGGDALSKFYHDTAMILTQEDEP